MNMRLLLMPAVLVGGMLVSLSAPAVARPTVDSVGLAANTTTPTRTGTPTQTPSPTATETPTATITSTATLTITETPIGTAEPLPSATTTSIPVAAPEFADYMPLIMQSQITAPIPTATPSSSPPRIPAFSHVFIIVMENKPIEQIIGNPSAPYINSLMQQYAVAANYYGTTHPSLPNYISMISGDTQGITSDCTKCFIDAPNIVDQLEAAGKTWKAYMESMPSPCFVGDSGSLYRQKHNPFIYFDNIRTNTARCNNLVPLSQFDLDLQANALPDYIWITPNMCNSIHDCSLATGDTWLQTWVTKIVSTPAWQQDGALFLTFDESKPSDDTGCCTYAVGGHILTLVISPLAKSAFQSQVAYDHYSLLRTIEEAWGMPLLNKANCDCSQPMADFFDTAQARHWP